MTRISLKSLIFALLLLSQAYAGKPPIFAGGDGAINGYDPVAYFNQEKPVRGVAQYTFEWKEGTFKFASAGNLEIFKADPEKYAPQYGGYCAYAVSKGATASTVPEAFSIVEGKLYLNYSLGVREQWRKNIPAHIKAADNNWPGVLN